ncbi:MAG: dienelactone hydrolase family protein [Gemmatimonadota bacterium]|nr:dienelactone hydrolase family protein [Gemmatimonadota bacterium]
MTNESGEFGVGDDGGEYDPHANTPLLTGGTRPESADLALVLLHGRGADAAGMLPLADMIAGSGVAALAPQAAGLAWYPARFMEPIERNQPWLDCALGRIRSIVAALADAGLPRERVVLGGFSQGACLATEFVARSPARYGGVIAFSGGMIGPPGTVLARAGSLESTPILMGCSDRDPHIPLERFRESAEALEQMGGAVDMRVYPGLGHTINHDELEAARELVARATADGATEGGE